MGFYNPPQNTYTDPESRGFFNSALTDYAANPAMTSSKRYAQAGNTGATISGQVGRDAGLFGLADLTQMLANKGRTDPRILGQQIGAIGRGTQSAQDSAAGTLAGGGWQNLGLGKVLQAAIGQQGQQRVSNAYASDADKAYARNQQNLGLLKGLVIDPQRDYAAISSGQYGVDRQAQQAQQAGIIGALGSILASL